MAPKNQPQNQPPPSFSKLLVDENLLGLARWLRFLGLDASLAMGWKDDEVAAFARKTRRTLITRDTLLAEEMGRDPVIRVRCDRPREQLKAVLRETGVPGAEAWFSRCVLCNKPLRALSAAEAASEPTVPDFVRARPAEPLWRCEHCGRIYWRGGHFTRTRAFLESIEAELREERAGEGPAARAIS